MQPAGPFEPCTNAQGAPQPCVSPEASEQTALVQDLDTGVFTPLVTGCPSPTEEEEGHACPTAVAEHADVPAGTVFGRGSVLSGAGSFDACPPFPYCGPFFQDATPDFSHVVVSSPVRLSEEPGAAAGLYEWSAGRLQFVGEGYLGPVGEKALTDDRHAISDDGSRVFWTRPGRYLFMRDTVSGNCWSCDAPNTECLDERRMRAWRREFQLASSNGERVLFTDAERLTTWGGMTGPYEAARRTGNASPQT